MLKNEYDNFGDIVELNFLDSYRNLSLKTYSLLKYAKEYCKNIKCILKVDMDVVFNINGYEKLCKNTKSIF